MYLVSSCKDRWNIQSEASRDVKSLVLEFLDLLGLEHGSFSDFSRCFSCFFVLFSPPQIYYLWRYLFIHSPEKKKTVENKPVLKMKPCLYPQSLCASRRKKAGWYLHHKTGTIYSLFRNINASVSIFTLISLFLPTPLPTLAVPELHNFYVDSLLVSSLHLCG